MAASPSFDADDLFPIGSVLDDRYRIEAVLGTGGMGRVYRAEHTKIGKSVAIKVLHADLTRNREASQRFQREAIASGRLDHPNIVGVSDFGVLDDGTCYLVMEVLEGESLGDRLARDRRIHWVEALDVLRGVLYGLRHAHERGVVHRDIKPDNVYLAHKDGDAMIKILDFGIAKLYAGSADDPASTRAGITVGTPAYLSPEQAVGGEITPASDLYSASIVLYEMLAGRAPFEDKDPLAMLGAHVSRPPPRFAEVAPGVDVPAPLEDIVQRGLRKAVAERIGTATDYLALLDAFSPPLYPDPRPASRLATAPVVDAAADASGPAAVPTTRPATPAPGAAIIATPLPGTAPAARAASIGMARLPRAVRTVSLADVSEPIPLTWILRSGVVIGLAILAAIALAIAAHCSGTEPGSRARLGTKTEPGAKTEPGSRTRLGAKAEPGAKTEPGAKAEPGAKTEPGPKTELGSTTEPASRPPAAPSAQAAGESAASPARPAPAAKPAPAARSAPATKPAPATRPASSTTKPALAAKPTPSTTKPAPAAKPTPPTTKPASAAKPAPAAKRAPSTAKPPHPR